MSASPRAAPATFPVASFAQSLQSAAGRLTWRVAAGTVAIAAALELWVIYEFRVDGAQPGDVPALPAMQVYLSGTIINLSMASALVFMTLVADEWVARGARRYVAYPVAVVAGSFVGAALQRALHRALDIASRYDAAGMPPEVSVMQPAVVFFEYLIWGSIIVFIYVNRRTALQAAARMNEAQVEQARTRRRTLESRLQARVEPQFLFNTLARVRALYDEDASAGGALLEDLIVYLRAALPHLRDSLSTLGKEVDLASAYMSIMRVHAGGRLSFAVEIPPLAAARDAAFPPMVLLPLVDHLFVASGGGSGTVPEVRISARAQGGRLRVEVTASGSECANARDRGVVRDVQERLTALYGDPSAIVVESIDASSTRVTMEIPYAIADGDHR